MHRLIRFFGVAVCLLASAACLPPKGTSVVDPAGGAPELILDAQGMPEVAYGMVGDGLAYASWDPARLAWDKAVFPGLHAPWQRPVLASGPGGGVGMIARDDGGDLVLLALEGLAWSQEESLPFSGTLFDLAITRDGRPVVAWVRYDGGLDRWEIWFAQEDESGWAEALAGTSIRTAPAGWYPAAYDVDLVLDGEDRPRILAAWGWTQGFDPCEDETELVYAALADGSWQSEALPAGGCEDGASLVVDRSGYAHVVYMGEVCHSGPWWNETSMGYLTNASGSWDGVTGVLYSAPAGGCDIAVGPGGNPKVVLSQGLGCPEQEYGCYAPDVFLVTSPQTYEGWYNSLVQLTDDGTSEFPRLEVGPDGTNQVAYLSHDQGMSYYRGP